jgi:hypothetical protein
MENNVGKHVELLEIRDKLKTKFENHKRLMEQAQTDLQAIERSLQLLNGDETMSGDAYPILPPSELHGLTQLDALKKIARAGNGEFYVRDAKRLFVAAGLVDNIKNVANTIYALTERSDCFFRVKRGKYKLEEPEENKKPMLLNTSRVTAAS